MSAAAAAVVVLALAAAVRAVARLPRGSGHGAWPSDGVDARPPARPEPIPALVRLRRQVAVSRRELDPALAAELERIAAARGIALDPGDHDRDLAAVVERLERA